MPLTKEVNQDELEKMVAQGDIKVSITELDGEVISSYTIKKFVIGKPDGSKVEPLIFLAYTGFYVDMEIK